MDGLKKEIIVFLQRKRLVGKVYHSRSEIEEDLREKEFSFAEDKFWFDKEWLKNYLDGKSMNGVFSILKKIDYKRKTYYRYRYKWLARIISFLSKNI